MPFLLAEVLNFQCTTHLIGVGSLSNVNIDAYFVSQFCPLSNSIWSEKLSYVYLSRMELPKTEYKVYTTSDLNNDILFKQAEKKLLLYGKYEQY